MGNCCCGSDNDPIYYQHKDLAQKRLVFIDFPDIEQETVGNNKYIEDEVIHPCIICYEKECCALLLPCKHSKLCAKCALYFKDKNQCPVCKSCINKAVRIF